MVSFRRVVELHNRQYRIEYQTQRQFHGIFNLCGIIDSRHHMPRDPNQTPSDNASAGVDVDSDRLYAEGHEYPIVAISHLWQCHTLRVI